MVLDYGGKKVLIIDLNPMVHRYFNAVRQEMLTATVEIDGKVVTVDTTVPALVFKQLVRLSGYGTHHMVVVHDKPNHSRKAYFQNMLASGGITGKSSGYKSSRGYVNPRMVQAQDIIINMLKKAGVMVLGKDNYEADDIVAEVVRVAKIQYPQAPIYIIGNDMDFAPLVDEQVSFYRYTRKKEYFEEGHLSLTKHAQITPRSYQRECESVTANKKLTIPYNTLLLAKLVRGDKSDDIPPLKRWTPTKYNKLVEGLIEDGVDLANTFKYHNWVVKYQLLDATGGIVGVVDDFMDIPQEYKVNKAVKMLVEAPKEVKLWRGILEKYMTSEEIDEIYARFTGMNLNGAFTQFEQQVLNRVPLRLSTKVPIPGLDIMKLQRVVNVLRIHLS